MSRRPGESDLAFARRLARFRADPAKVRVSIQRCGLAWLASVGPRGGDPAAFFHCLGKTPKRAVWFALKAASETVLGVDLFMDWAYEHPWRTP